jgi:ABC-type multidrug transport system ATPase subunit/ABC-type transport system involved in multi-copper enzyme maturation permease subunit
MWAESLYSWVMTIGQEISSNTPALVVRTQGSDRSLEAGPSYSIGRNPESDIVINEARVSWRHAVLRLEGSTWLLEDVGSTNGTFLGAQRVHRVEITKDCVLRLGHPDDGQRLWCSVVAPPKDATAIASPVRDADPPTDFVQLPASGVPVSAAAPAYSPAAPPAPPPYQPPAPPPYQPPAAPPPPRPYQPAAAQPYQPAAARPYPPVQPGGPSGSSIFRQPSAVMRLPTRVLRIGRATDNEVVVPDLSVSRYHAELRHNTRGGYEIADLGSHNGTYVNGQRITMAPVTEADIIGIGPATFHMVGQELQEFIDTGDVSLNVRELTVRISGGKVLLDHVNFPLGERCLLGVIGPSGAGKSTLLGALTGMQPAGEGSVLYDDRDLYKNYAELKHRIGLVPQQDIMHTQLTARRALRYAAELRFPRDTSARERNERVDEVLEELGLTAHAQTRASSLSGGQRKRVSVALELLTKPSLLFLDEPTSGLDPGLDKSVMEMMAGLAHDGRTVIVVTHSVANLDLCDRLLVLVPGGKIAFFGPPRDGLRHFGKPGWAEVFQAFEAEPGRDWAGEFRRSPLYAQYITAGMNAAAPVTGPRQITPAPRARNHLSQLSTLVRRYLSVIASDKGYLATLAIAPIALAVILRAASSSQGLVGGPRGNANAITVLDILAIGACFIGTLNAVREIIKEKSIYTRERAAGLSAGAYLWSKLLVLGVLSALQAVLMTVVGLVGRPVPPHGSLISSSMVELVLAMALLAIASMTIGLLISAVVRTSETTLVLLFISVMLQIVLTGGVIPINGKVGVEQLAWISPSRWGFGSVASTTNLNVLQPGQKPDPLWTHSAHTWLVDVGMQIVLAVVFAFITWRLLKRTSPGRR